MEILTSHICDCFGVNKVALSYTVRGFVDPVNTLEPAANSSTPVGYYSIIKEFIVITPHNGDSLYEGNAKLY